MTILELPTRHTVLRMDEREIPQSEIISFLKNKRRELEKQMQGMLLEIDGLVDWVFDGMKEEQDENPCSPQNQDKFIQALNVWNENNVNSRNQRNSVG